jgi:hypothetical protein
VVSPSPFLASLVELNRERRDARLAVAIVGQRVAQLTHLLPEGQQFIVGHRLQACAKRVEVNRDFKFPTTELGYFLLFHSSRNDSAVAGANPA